MIDIIIPTMWLAKSTIGSLKKYSKNKNVGKIIIIDNNKTERPTDLKEIIFDPKIELVSYGRNIYVNPAWNEGYNRSTADIIAIINDDIVVDDTVFDLVIKQNLQPGDLVGVNLRGYQDNYKIDDYINTKEEIVKLNYDKNSPIGGQAWAFGICMFMHRKTYKIIPSLYQIWYGDDYLAQQAINVYAINSNRIKGKISETLTKFNDPDSDISKRIELDSKNLLKFGHFHNSENWDIPKNMIAMYERQRKLMNQVQTVNVFETEYQLARKMPGDINKNLHILYELAKECETVVETGVRGGVSTRAFLNTDASLLSFDSAKNDNVDKLFALAKSKNKNAEYIIDNVLEVEIPETDLLFINTVHTYDRLKKELKLHGNKAKKYIAFHDTYRFGLTGEDPQDNKGLMTAIIEFMIENPHWRFKTHTTINNGMTVLERTINNSSI